MANAAAAVQMEDDAEPADAEPWVLEGWGDGPSVSEVAQQAALRLGPYIKNVPTTLVGLGAGGGRRVLSAGHQGRGLLKVSEARRKPGPGPTYPQGDRRASGPAALTAGSQAATAALRRAAMQQTLDVGDESDVEPTAYYGGGAAPVAPSSYGHAAVPQAPLPASQSRITPAQRVGAGLRQQHAQQIAQSTLGAATRLGRREAVAGTSSAASAAAAVCTAAADPSNGGSPRQSQRSVSAEAYPSSTHGGGAPSGATARVPNVSGRGVPPGPAGSGSTLHPITPAVHSHPPLPPQHPPTHLEPLGAPVGRGAAGRPAAGPGDPGLVSTDRPTSGPHAESQPVRSSSLSSGAAPQPAGVHGHNDSILSPGNGNGHTLPGAAAASSGLAPGPGAQAAGALLLPGLFTPGRRGNSFRTDGGGLSGWDPEAPAIQSSPPPGPSPQQPSSASNVSLWIGTTTATGGVGGQAVGMATAAASGRGAPLAEGQPPPRRDGSLRIQRGSGPPSTGLTDLPLGPERSAERAGQAASSGSLTRVGRAQAAGGAASSRSASPDVVGGRGCAAPTGFSAPQQDALTEFCASRSELGSAGAASVSGTDRSAGRAVTSPGGAAAGMPVSVAVRVPSLTRTTAVGRVN